VPVTATAAASSRSSRPPGETERASWSSVNSSGLLGVFEVVREEQRTHVWSHHEEGRAQRLVEWGLSLELAGLPPALQDLRERSLELLLEGRHERPAIASGHYSDVVEFPVRREQHDASIHKRPKHLPDLVRRGFGGSHALFDRGQDPLDGEHPRERVAERDAQPRRMGDGKCDAGRKRTAGACDWPACRGCRRPAGSSRPTKVWVPDGENRLRNRGSRASGLPCLRAPWPPSQTCS